MQTISLTFSGPVHIESFSNNFPENAKEPGVYIWGFMQQKKFIPYYVGKHQTSVSARLQNHLHDIKKDASTYMRLTKAYMEGTDTVTPYYLDDKFPLITRNYRKSVLPKWYSDNLAYFKDRIAYLNSESFLRTKGVTEIKKIGRGDCPISNLSDKSDYLSENVDKLFAIYAAYRCAEGIQGKERELNFELIEAFVKYHLRGKTASKSLSFHDTRTQLKSNGINIKIVNINEYLTIFKEDISELFSGYGTKDHSV